MEQSKLKKSIISIQASLKKCDGYLSKADVAVNEENYERYEHEIVSSISHLENSLMQLRPMVNANYSNKNPLQYEQMLNMIATDIYHIRMDRDGDVLHMILPCLLPHYKQNNKNIITEPLNKFIREYKKQYELPKYEKVFFVVINHVSADTPDFIVRDNDNYEYKQLVNTLAFWFLKDDSTQYCSMINSTVKSESDYTEVFIVPLPEFVNWYIKHPIK